MMGGISTNLFLSWAVFVLIKVLVISSDPTEASSTTPSPNNTNKNNRRCERLKTSLTYSQEKAPRDISAVLPLIVEKVNREIEGVVDVEVLYEGGDMQSRVGEHMVQCLVTRLFSVVGALPSHEQSQPSPNKQPAIAMIHEYDEMGIDEHGRKVITQCFQVPFTILDTNECTLPASHGMRHKCNSPAVCVNTLGSYECVCPVPGFDISKHASENVSELWNLIENQTRSPWDLSFSSSSSSSCPAKASTYKCCDAIAHSQEGSSCRSSFHCPVDPCSIDGTNDCASTAECQRAKSPLDKPSYTCVCPEGLMGNGHACRKGVDLKPRPMVMYDGVTPTDETIRHGFYCGCTRPVVDACAGFPKCEGNHEICIVTNKNTPKCACKPGFVKIEPYGCVDGSPPILKLRHDPNHDGITRLKQGDNYKEYAVDIVDDNAEDYLRSLKITYSRPLPPGCLAHIGSFHVNYTVATPWTTPPYVRVTRNVVIEDIDECTLDVNKYETVCPELIPRCDVEAGARCVNKIGSYTCQCPRFTTGDGFQVIGSVEVEEDKNGNGKTFLGAPDGYSGGTGCRDTSEPVIQVLGPNPKVFRICKCGGLTGLMKRSKLKRRDNAGNSNGGNPDLVNHQREGYGGDLKQIIKATAGAELCATSTHLNPSPTDCVRATDHTYQGNIDLTSSVKVGEPVQTSPLEWRVPYNVIDAAGNSAKTAWRDIVVEEVDLVGVEEKIRDEVLADKDFEIQEAVNKALEMERAKTSARTKKSSSSGRENSSLSCPPCVCSKNGGGKSDLSFAECNVRCDEIMRRNQQTCEANTGNVNMMYDGTTIRIHPVIADILAFAEGIVSPSFALIILFCTVAALSLFILQRVYAVIMSSREGWYYFTPEDEEKEREMLDSVTYFRSPDHSTRHHRQNGSSSPGSAPPRSSMSLSPNRMQRTNGNNNDIGGGGGGGAVGGGIFSPPENRVYGERRERLFASQNSGEDSIYQTMSPITPSRSSGSSERINNVRENVTPYNLRQRY